MTKVTFTIRVCRTGRSRLNVTVSIISNVSVHCYRMGCCAGYQRRSTQYEMFGQTSRIFDQIWKHGLSVGHGDAEASQDYRHRQECECR